MTPLERLLAWALALVGTLLGGLFGAFRTGAARAVAPIQVRPATPDEVIDVRHAVLREGRPRETAVFDGDDAPTTRHWVAVQADRVVGVVSVMVAPMPAPHPSPRPAAQLRGMAVLAGLQRTGVGRQLLEAVHADVVEPLWCNARANVVGFYAAAGWMPVGERFEIAPIGPHQRMVYRFDSPAAAAMAE